jgi:magnesium transporter
MIHVVVYSKDTGYQLEDPSRLAPYIHEDKHDLVWIDFEAATTAEAALLSQFFHFHPLAIEDCVTETLLPKIDDFGDYIFLVLHGSRSSGDESPFETSEVNFFLGVHYLVTYHDLPSRSIKEARDRCLKNLPSIAKGPDFLLHEILDRMVDHYFPMMEILEDEMERIELEVFSQPKKETLNDIVKLKKQVLLLRRVITPQQEILNRLSRDNFAVISPKAAIYYRDVYDHLVRISDLADSYRDQLSNTLEAYLSVISNRLNEVMKVLTMFTATLMPLTLITGIYGMNFDNMPELRMKYGYYGVLGAMGVMAIALVIYFRKKKWL